jgi:hypothetical protein
MTSVTDLVQYASNTKQAVALTMTIANNAKWNMCGNSTKAKMSKIGPEVTNKKESEKIVRTVSEIISIAVRSRERVSQVD